MNATPPSTPEMQQSARANEIAQLQRQVKSGASNFYWIAALSVINSLVGIFGGGVTFLVGLGITQIIDAIALILVQELGSDNEMIFRGIGFVLGLAIAGLFALFGVFAARGNKWAFVIGMILYFMDGLLFLLVRDFWSIGFHLFMLWLIFVGLRALNKWKSLYRAEAQFEFPNNIGI